MELRRRMMGNGNGSSIPYQRIEYLETSGTQYIDTGINGNNDNLEITLDVYPIGARTSQGFFGNIYSSYNATALRAKFTNSKYIIEKNLNTRQTVEGTTIINFVGDQRYLFVSNKQGIFINGDFYSSLDYSTSGGTNNRSILLFRSSHNMANFSYSRYYMFSIKDNGVTVFDMVPVRIGTTGYIYDKVSGELFGNIGTGDFILGPDIN